MIPSSHHNVCFFLLKSFHFRTNPYISNVTQQCRCSPMLIFRAWATCDLIALTAKKVVAIDFYRFTDIIDINKNVIIESY